MLRLRFVGLLRLGFLSWILLIALTRAEAEEETSLQEQPETTAAETAEAEAAPSGATTPAADGESVKPGINEKFLDPDLDVDQWVQRFEVESREVVAARDEIVAELKLAEGDRIADVGAGTGLFVAPFARAVGGTGKVYALDIAPKFVERIEMLARHEGLEQVDAMVCGQQDVRLPPSSIDTAFICDVYHHFEYPADSLRSIFKALRPGGELVVIDFERIPGKSDDWTLGHVRAGKEVFREEIERAGFQFVEEPKLDGLKDNYFLRFRRPSGS